MSAARQCPVCVRAGKISQVVPYDINFTDSVLLCEREECSYPFGYGDFEYVVSGAGAGVDLSTSPPVAVAVAATKPAGNSIEVRSARKPSSTPPVARVPPNIKNNPSFTDRCRLTYFKDRGSTKRKPIGTKTSSAVDEVGGSSPRDVKKLSAFAKFSFGVNPQMSTFVENFAAAEDCRNAAVESELDALKLLDELCSADSKSASAEWPSEFDDDFLKSLLFNSESNENQS